LARMCGRIIQSSGPLRYAIVDGLNVRGSRVHNYPLRWNGAASQELQVISAAFLDAPKIWPRNHLADLSAFDLSANEVVL
jgi:hypothetical protein